MMEDEGGSATSLEEFAGAAFGDFSGESAPDLTGSTAPETPAPDASAAPETAAAAAPEGEGSTAAPPATPDAAASPETPVAVPPADDPLKDAAPLTYTVDGVTKAYEGIKVLGDAGAIIDPAALKDVQQRLSEHEHFRTANQQLYQKVQQYEAQGGEAKLAELSEQLATTNAVGANLVPLFAGDVKNLLKYLQYSADGTSIEWNEEARAGLLDKLEFARKVASFDAKSAFQTSTTQAQTQGTQEQVRERATQTALQKFRETYRDWSPQDFAAAEKYVRAHQGYLVRPAGEAEAKAYGLKVGELMIDYPTMGVWADERNATRLERAKTATTVTDAAKENATRLAAALPGTQKTPAVPARPAVPAATPRKDAEDAWDLRERLAAGAMRR